MFDPKILTKFLYSTGHGHRSTYTRLELRVTANVADINQKLTLWKTVFLR